MAAIYQIDPVTRDYAIWDDYYAHELIDGLEQAGVLVAVKPDEIIDIAADTTGHYPQGSGYFALLLPAGKYAVVKIENTDD